MRKNRLLMSLIFTLSYGAVACGADGNGLNDSTESLKRLKLSDGGSAAADHSHDSDEAAEEELEHDGGTRHFSNHDAGAHHADPFDHGDGGDCDHGREGPGGFGGGGFDGKGDKGPGDDHGGKGGDDDHGGKGGDDKGHEDAGFHFGGSLDGGFPHK